jgi:hypothetical protein
MLRMTEWRSCERRRICRFPVGILHSVASSAYRLRLLSQTTQMASEQKARRFGRFPTPMHPLCEPAYIWDVHQYLCYFCRTEIGED